jgi:Zn-dependent protease
VPETHHLAIARQTARRYIGLVVPVCWERERRRLPGGLPVELRGSRWGAEPEEAKPGWPGANVGPEAQTEPTDGQASQWWPEPGNGAAIGNGTGGANGESSSDAHWGISSDNGEPTGPGPAQGLASPGSTLERSGYSLGPQVTTTRSRADDGRPPATTGSPQPGRPGSGPAQPQSALRRAWQRLVTALAAVGAFLAKFGALLLKVKYVGLVLSMLVSIVAYSLFFGWSFAVGIVLLILVHEMGHVVELRRQGVPASAPLFIPFLGAFVNMKGSPRSAFQEALSGLAGPLVGTAASVVVAFWANAIGSNFLMALAFFGFFVNLFNLLPVLPLDGGRAAAALHPALWLLGLVALVVFEFLYPSPVVPIILILGGIELWRRWRYRNSPASRAYNALLPQQRFAIGAFYLTLVAVTIVGAHATYVARSL